MAFGGINSGTTIELTQDQLNAIIKQTLLAAHPVGSIYQSLDSTSPADLFGGTWEKLENRFLLAAYDGCTAGNIGGEASHTHGLSNNGVAMIGNYADTISFQSSGLLAKNIGSDMYTWPHDHDVKFTTDSSHWNELAFVGLRGATDSNSTMPPYIAVWTWKRTA